MGNWDELINASEQATGETTSKSVNEGKQRPLTPDEEAFRMWEVKLNNIGKSLNELFTEMRAYKQKKGLR